jgi:hypothetical protein
LRRAARERPLIPAFLPADVLGNLIAINQMDPYDSDNSDGGPEFPSQSTIPEPLPFNVLRVGRASVAIRRIVHSYTPILVYSAGQEPAGKAQLDRDQLFARDRHSTHSVFPCL